MPQADREHGGGAGRCISQLPASGAGIGRGPHRAASRLNSVDIEERLREAELEIVERRPEHQILPTLDRIAMLTSMLGDPQRAIPGPFR